VANEHVSEASLQLRKGQQVPPLIARDFLRWFGAQRRGYWVVQNIRRELEEAGLETDPDFESAYIDSEIRIRLAKTTAKKKSTNGKTTVVAGAPVTLSEDSPSSRTQTVYDDPTFRISKLAAANREPTSIAPDATVQQAATIMLAKDYSQLPVMTSPREVKGMISWTSIGARLSVGKVGNHVRELMDGHQEISAELSLFQAIPIIVEYQYVLVRGSDARITGIVSASDLSLQFQQLAEPFLLLGEIENHIRRILGDNFSAEEFASLRDRDDGRQKVSSVADLSFGEYIRLLENEGRWKKVKIPIDRSTFCTELDKVREIRNDVMHFDPDGILPEELNRLRHFARFLQRLQAMGLP